MFTSWVIAELFSKGITYLSMLAVPGGFLVFMLAGRYQLDAGLRRTLLALYLIPACLLGILAVSVFFLIQVGDINQRGLMGMLDRDMGSLLASTAIGDGLQWRLNGFVLALVASGLAWVALRRRPDASHKPLDTMAPAVITAPTAITAPAATTALAALLASLAFGISFAVLGHVANLSVPGRILIILHFVAVALWGGALLPLLMVLRHVGREARDTSVDNLGLQAQLRATILLLTEYGRLAWAFIGGMLLSGVILIWMLLDSPANLFSTTYGRLLCVKLVLVTGLMLLGALNKYRLVPRLTDSPADITAWLALRRSIKVETLLVFLVLTATALFTTVTGPA